MIKVTVVHKRFRYKNRKLDLVVSSQYKKVMKLISKAIKENKEVIFNHQILINDKPVYDGKWYDQVTVEIN